MKAVTRAVIELGGTFEGAQSYSAGRTTLWMLSDGSYQALDDRGGYSGKYVCTRDDFQVERFRLHSEYMNSGDSIYKTFEQWLKTYKEGNGMYVPEVGEECECTWGGKKSWWRCVKTKFGFLVNKGDPEWLMLENMPCYKSSEVEFRPIQSEEDKLCEKLISEIKDDVYVFAINGLESISMKQSTGHDVAVAVIEYLYKDKNWRPIKPMTEDEFVDAAHGGKRMTYSEMYRAGCRFLDGGE